MSDSRPIRVRFASDSKLEPGMLGARIKLCIGDESVSSFARKVPLPEATIRSYIDGRKPVYDKLVKIAAAANVNLDWLATGSGPMARSVENQPLTPLPAKSASPLARRVSKILELLDAMPEQESAALLDELFSRAHQAAELAELKRAGSELRATHKKTA